MAAPILESPDEGRQVGQGLFIVGFFATIWYVLRRKEHEGALDFGRNKTEKGTSFQIPGGGPAP